MRILHVVGRMDRGGTETWLMRVLRIVDPIDFHMDFLVQASKQGAYDDEIRQTGSLVIPCLDTKRPFQYAHNFKDVICKYGPYDILHSHVHYYSGFVLRLGNSAGIKTLIAHSRTDARVPEEQAKKPRRMYVNLMKRMISRYADCGLAVSKKAAEDLFGLDWTEDPRWRVLYTGIDIEPFKQAVDARQIRAELGVPKDSLVVGHVGNFREPKNHTFLIDVAYEAAKVAADVCFLLVGDGPFRDEIERKVIKLGLQGKVIFTGVRADVPRLMLGAMDVFVLPSLWEGLPNALVEAQAAGLPCVISDYVTEEADVVKHLIRRLSLVKPTTVWTAEILDLRKNKEALRDPNALAVVENSAFNIKSGVEELIRIYESCN